MSLMLPSSQSQSYKSNTKKMGDKPSDPNVHPGVQTTELPEERLDPHTIEDPTINQNADRQPANEQGEGNPSPRVADPPRLGYDQYGEELGKNARVWKTYMQEASRWDAGMVDGWHSFVIESSKSLQPDPTETSAKTLSTISHTLLLIANGQPGSLLNLAAPELETFVAPASAVCVNALWFLSLSLSVSVSLIAMLAKAWTHSYVSDLMGQPYQQARERQRRWDALKEWRVPEVIVFLPSLLHLALFGLTVYLWNIHLGAAIPVLVVTGVSVLVYGTSTVLPLLNKHCPYHTPLTRLIPLLPILRHLMDWIMYAVVEESITQPESREGREEDLMDEVTSRALAWLIVNYEDIKSADIALQAIAGATAKLPMFPLRLCNAPLLLSERLQSCFGTRQTTGEMYLKDRSLLEAASLYGRALITPASFQLELNNFESGTPWGHFQTPWISIYLVDNGIVSVTSEPNKVAFALSSISMGAPGLKVNPYIVLTNRLLQLYLVEEITLELPALLALLRAATHWSSFDIADEDLGDYIRLMMTTVQFANSVKALDHTLQAHGLVGAALTAFACSRRSYHSWPLFESSDQHIQRFQADSIARYYEHSPSPTTVDSLFTFGLLELLRHHTTSLNARDFPNILHAFTYYPHRPAVIDIHTLPMHMFGSNYRYVYETAMSLLKPDSQGAYAWNEEARAACLAVFSPQYLGSLPQVVDVYVLALDTLSTARLGLLKRSCCSVLSTDCNSNLLNELLRRNLLPSYLEALEGEDERVVPYIMRGIAGIIACAVDESEQLATDRTAILWPLLSYSPFLNAVRRSDHGPSRLTVDTLEVAYIKAWLPRLEDMMSRIPEHIYESGILFITGPDLLDNAAKERCDAVREQIIQLPGNSPDWL
ncbi:hypothetical protein FRC12_008893 [Ceratobasidium sp. 428]|nr:hypothetical protein FRC12_008893 [Ceratobasidium sp. 428]